MSDPSTAYSEAEAYLSTFLNQTLHLHISDGRIFVGQMKCTDNERNIILACTQEYRQPSETDAKRALTERGASDNGTKVNLEMRKRFVGLVVVPGQYIEKIEVEG